MEASIQFSLSAPAWPSLIWPVADLGEAINQIARRKKLDSRASLSPAAPPPAQPDEETLRRWLEAVASQWHLEVESVQTSYAEVDQLICGAGPALVRLPSLGGTREAGFLVLLKSGWWLSLLGPDLAIYHIRPEHLRDALCAEIEAPHLALIDHFLAHAKVRPHRRARSRRAILNEQLGATQLHGCWFLRLSPSANFERQTREARLPRIGWALLFGYLVQLGLTIGAWWLIGENVLTGQFDSGWLFAWALLLLSAIGFQALTTLAQGQLATGVGGLFKLRLLYGILQLEPEEIRHQGAGQFLGRVMESEAVELLALGGGFSLVLAVMQLAVAAAILALGAGGWPHALLLLLWLGITLGLNWRYLKQSHGWIDTYREMTHDLVERMMGHRTRLAQEDPAHWHDDEEQFLNHYVRRSERLDHLAATLSALVPRGWSVIGLAGIAYAFLLTSSSPVQLAISLGGVLLALQALTQLVAGMQSLIGATIAWTQVGPLFQAAKRPKVTPSLHTMAISNGQAAPETAAPVITTREVSFRYPNNHRDVLHACTLQIRHGDRLLLEGPSGGGKSTLASLLSGWRSPASGLLLLWGYDRPTMGTAEWRRRVVTVPQFHENHVFTGSLAFNVLMGRQWPPQADDLLEAEVVCRELGLGDVLDRMPAGMQQMIGESGWQLSHGECSRLYMARALLQQADVLIFDESFGALDPASLQRALQCVLRRATTLLVIAHP